MCVATAVAITLPLNQILVCSSVAAGPLFPWLDTGFASSSNPQRPNGGWTTATLPEKAVAARDPAWTATVVALAPNAITTGSIATENRPAPLPGPRLTGHSHALAGNASYYWEDQMTATGERFDKRAMTAAHKTLPFGTRVRVTRNDNGKSVIVRINDRGPYKPGRIIDLSERAAENLGMTGVGVAAVHLEVLGR
jgi:rare lipoprotein A